MKRRREQANAAVAYQCPCCGAPLAYDGASGKLTCAACQNSYELDVLETMQAEQNEEDIRFDVRAEAFDTQDAQQMQAYICENCGAELVTEDTTTATECPYCGSPTILPDNIEGGVKPELVVPFVVSKEEAQKQFEDYFKGKKLMPNIFLTTRNRIAEMRRLYVPYWMFDCSAYGDIVYEATRRHVRRMGEWEITDTDHYAVHRAGSMMFEHIPVDGSEKLDNMITESLEPYDMSAAVPFKPAVLAGAMADHADVDAQACVDRVKQRVSRSMEDAIRGTVGAYSSVAVRSRNIYTEDGRATPVLMPVWLITTEKEDKVYTFAINGQTGKLTCDVPADTTKSLLWGFGAFAIVFMLAALLLMSMEMLDGFGMGMAGCIALMAAFIVVSVLKAELKQAEFQSAAASYVREGSFGLDVRSDHFLYRTTQRRRIETNQPRKM